MRFGARKSIRGGTATGNRRGSFATCGSRYRRSGIRSLAIAAFALLSAPPIFAAVPADLLYFALDDAIVVMDLNDGSVTELEHQLVKFRGLAFESSGKWRSRLCDCRSLCHRNSIQVLRIASRAS